MKIANPSKPFNYAIEMDGFDVATCQSIEIGEVELSVDEHGDGDKKIKTAGHYKVPDVTIEKLLASDIPDNYFFTWLQNARKQLPEQYKKSFFIKLLDETGTKAVRIWLAEDAFCFNFKWGKLGDNEEGNFMETAKLSLDDLKVVK